MEKKCRMLAIDSSTKKSAYAIFDNGVYVTSGVIDHSMIREMEDRLYFMATDLYDVFKDYKPDLVYIEEVVVPRNAHTQRFLARLQGIVYGYCILTDAEFYTIRPTEWRKLVGIEQGKLKRDALKDKAIDLVKEKLGIEVNDDEAEAILIGCAAIKMYNPEIPISELFLNAAT